MEVKKILISQPRPTSEKSPYFDLERKYGVEVVFRPFIKIEGLTSREFRQTKVNIADYSAIIFTARTAIDHFFRLCKETRYTVPDTLKYFCISEMVAHYLQHFIVYRKRKIFYSESGRIDELAQIITKHNKETYMMPMSDIYDEKAAALDSMGIEYTKSVMYRTVNNNFGPDEPRDFDMIIFFSPAGVRSLVVNIPDYKERGAIIGGMGQTTIEAIHEAGLELEVTTDASTPSMAAAIDKYLHDHGQPVVTNDGNSED